MWTNASQNADQSAYIFGNGQTVYNGGEALSVDPGREVVVFSKKAQMYQSKDDTRVFVALCRTDIISEH